VGHYRFGRTAAVSDHTFSDDVRLETGQEALECGKQVAQDAAQAASESAENVKETVRESGRDQAEQLRDSAEEHGQVPSQDRSASRPNRS
jgi:hypothetical protein